MKNDIKIIYYKYYYLIKQFFCLFIIYQARYIYIKSLKGCNGDEFSCLRDIQYIIDGINYCIISSLLLLLYFFLIQIKFCSFYHLFIFISVLIELALKDHGNSFSNHGILNLCALFLILFIGEIFIMIILIITHLIKNKKLKLIFALCLFLAFIRIFMTIKDEYNCLN